MSKIFKIENLRNYYKKKIAVIDHQLEDMREKKEQLQKERGAWEQIKKIELSAIQNQCKHIFTGWTPITHNGENKHVRKCSECEYREISRC